MRLSTKVGGKHLFTNVVYLLRKTKYLIPFLPFLFALLLASCSGDKYEEKGFALTPNNSDSDSTGITGRPMLTRPGSMLLTGNPEHRLTAVFMVNYVKKTKQGFIGSIDTYNNYSHLGDDPGNQWNYNYMPGLEAVYGYNLVNISHFNISTLKQKLFFDNPVLIKTLYYPSFSKDTLNYEPVSRNYYLLSVYDEDTNQDSLINIGDLRRLYYFDIDAENKQLLIPANYSVTSSKYDPANDYMYIYAQHDSNNNGSRNEGEDIHVFWIDLKDPLKMGNVY